MSNRELSIVAGIANGVERAAGNIANIEYRRQQLERQKERDRIDRRYKDATIKKAELELDDAALENEQNKMMHERALERARGAALTIGAISAANGTPRSDEGVATDSAGQDQGSIGQRQGSVVPFLSSYSRGQGPAPYLEAIQDELPPNSSMRVGRTTIRSKKPDIAIDVKDNIIRKIAEGETLQSGEQKIYDDIIKRQVAERASDKRQAAERVSDKGPSYSEQFRTDISDASERIKSGEPTDNIIKEMRGKYPATFSSNHEWNLKSIGKQAQAELGQIKNQAIQELRRAGYPVTDNNIKAAIKQLRGQ